MSTAGATAVSPAFAACEALFNAHPEAVCPAEVHGEEMTVSAAGRLLRLYRNDVGMGRFYRIYHAGSMTCLLVVSRIGNEGGEIVQALASAVPVDPSPQECRDRRAFHAAEARTGNTDGQRTAPGGAGHPWERTTGTGHPWERTSGPVHEWFSLSYANFLVVHRAQLQSMPLDWQRQFTDLLEELDAAYLHLDTPAAYEVKAVKDAYVGELTPGELTMLGITRGDDDSGYYYDSAGRELGEHDHVGVPAPDPVPHYRHAYLPPDEAAITAARLARAERTAR